MEEPQTSSATQMIKATWNTIWEMSKRLAEVEAKEQAITRNSTPLTQAHIDHYLAHVAPEIWDIFDAIIRLLHQSDPLAFEAELAEIEALIRAAATRTITIPQPQKS